MGGIRAVVGASVEEEEAAEPSSDPARALSAVAPQPVPVGPAGDATVPESPSSAQPVEKTAQPEIAAEATASGPLAIPRMSLCLRQPPSPSRLLARSRKRLRLG
jgi:hypothetical protein